MHNAVLYQENNCSQKNTSLHCFKKYANIKWKEDNKIVDLGCGEGTVMNMLKKYFPENAVILGCDINEDMLGLARERFGDEKTSFMVYDIVSDVREEMEENFSHVFSFFAFNWIKDQRRAFNNIYELLESDGEFFLVIVGKSSINDVYRSLGRNSKWSTYVDDIENHISLYHDMSDPKKEVKDILGKIGFDNSFVEVEDIIYTFDTVEDMKNTLEAINPFKIPADKQNEFWEDYLNLWKKFEGLENHSFIKNTLKYKVVIIQGHKPVDSKKM